MTQAASSRVSTGVPGLDQVLAGGLPPRRMYLLQGDPGAGKTTMGLQFVLHAAARGEPCLFVTLSETKEELAAVAAAHDWSLDGLHVFELSRELPGDDENTLYLPAEVELGERMQAILREIERIGPTRVVLDSCSELRLLAQGALRFRRQLVALKEKLLDRDCTILLLENPQHEGGDPLLQSLVHGVIMVEQRPPSYGAERRRLRVMKLREVAYRTGYHDLVIRQDGVEVFPRLTTKSHDGGLDGLLVPSGIPALDLSLGGGFERGTSALLAGPAGSGKSSLACQYAIAAARRGEHVAMFTFDEGNVTLLTRARKLGMPLEPHLVSDRIALTHIDPVELSFGEFAAMVRRTVEASNTRMVIIDSLNGYLQTMPEENLLSAQLHQLLGYLRGRAVITILVMAQHGLVGEVQSPLDASYLADTVVLLRYFEALGRVRKAISVVKKRSGVHEDTIRELRLDERGITVGEPLVEFRGVLTGTPVLRGVTAEALLSEPHG